MCMAAFNAAVKQSVVLVDAMVVVTVVGRVDAVVCVVVFVIL